MKYSISFSGHWSGKIVLPASKSISNRVLILKALSNSPYELMNLSDCDDTNVMQVAFTSNEKVIDIKAAGTAMRFLTAYLSQLEGERIITGTERMKNRPIRLLVNALRQLGADIEYLEKEGFPPLKINGKKLSGGQIGLDGGVSSQFISALMMIAPCMSEGLILDLSGEIISKPYIQMTMQLMKEFGADVVFEKNLIQIKPQRYIPCAYTVESDWSAASYWYEMVSLSSGHPEIELIGLNKESTQGDARVAELFGLLGVATEFTDDGVKLSKQPVLVDKFEYDFVNEPDLAQTFVVLCALKDIPFRFTGLQSLKIKETDRIAALQKEMKKLGYLIHDVNNNQLEWNGERCEAEADPCIDTYDDHRMAMAFAPAAIAFEKININDPLVVSKSYPHFWEDLKKAGFLIHSS